MKILVACEESQAVCKAFRERGHEAYSCDIIECSGGHPEWHIMGDALKVINGRCEFETMDGTMHRVDDRWDMIIAFPPCTHLAVSGARHFEKKRNDGRQRDAIEFFAQFLQADCYRICVENPVNIITGDGKYLKKWFPDLIEKYRSIPAPCTQIIQPYEYGHESKKATCLWLNGLPRLKPTNAVEPEYHISGTGRKWDKWFFESSLIQDLEERSKFRSKTFPGIAKAMAEQWG